VFEDFYCIQKTVHLCVHDYVVYREIFTPLYSLMIYTNTIIC